MSFFGKHFVRLLEQEEIQDTVRITDTEAMETQLDPGTQVTDYEVDAPVLDGGEVTAQSNAHQAQELVGIIGKMEEFTNWLNSEKGDSVQSQLHAASCDTLLISVLKFVTLTQCSRKYCDPVLIMRYFPPQSTASIT